MGERDLVGGLAGGGAGHVGEGGLDVFAVCPDGDFLQGVAVGDGGLFEAIGDRDRREAVDAADFAMAVAKTRGVAVSSCGDGVTADVDGGLCGLLEELIFYESVHLLCLCGVAGFEGEAHVGKEALGMVNVVVVDADGEVGRSGCGFAGVVAGGKGDEGKNGQCCCEYCVSANDRHRFSCWFKCWMQRNGWDCLGVFGFGLIFFQ